eukprot:CAMPEP_0194394522 /NCGR_PEP_ID=MMETSP0174-20130528/123899_1 /TAXON_ID=216777 /ORGANISM="Proboscia alata, Strain PI-D3" /LENGTH=512 /DNA_ID=CAMNT_0039190325 /DNA_START=14 /DNA_END=1552 /DNA_ORIENTATION=+
MTNIVPFKKQKITGTKHMLEQGILSLTDVYDSGDGDESNNKNETDDIISCSSLGSDCDGCYGYSSFCHFCEFDNSCHAIGSVSGCLIGASCEKEPGPPTPSPTLNPDSCSAKTDCNSCTLSSSFCHWCEFDNSCHTIGSIYGCLSGVDCYSNKVCQRTVSEPVHNWNNDSNVPSDFVTIVILIAMILLCCISVGMGILSCMKGAYDDLLHASSFRNLEDADIKFDRSPSMLEMRSKPKGAFQIRDMTEEETYGENLDMNHGLGWFDSVVSTYRRSRSCDSYTSDESAQMDLLDNKSGIGGSTNGYQSLSLSSSSKSSVANSAEKLFLCCKFTYVFSLTILLIAVYTILYFYPRVPDYNICSDVFDWKSIVDSMEALGLAASFEMLISVYNPNQLEIELVSGSGTFKLSGAQVGSFEIPPITIPPGSINDYLFTTSFTPDEWQALSLTTDYYMGSLAFTVDAKAFVRIPQLFGYTFEVDFDDYLVHVLDDISDRHLCKCQAWQVVGSQPLTLF